MANTIDNRIVGLEFNAAAFDAGVAKAINSLDGLSEALKMTGTTEAIDRANASFQASQAPLNGIAEGVSNISSKFTILGAIGFSVVQNLTNGFMSLGGKLTKAIAGPLIEGGKKRALAIEQAKFQFKGLGMNVDKTMKSALAAVKDTAFGLDEAATAASVLGASGIKAGNEMTRSLRAISGVAAMTGTGYSDVADIFSNVAGQGRVMGNDLLRMGQRGINAAAILGKAMGKSEKEVREMVSKGKISFKEFAKVMADTFGKHATKANETFTGALKNMKSAFSRIGAKYFVSQFEAFRITLNALRPVIDKVNEAMSPLLGTDGTKPGGGLLGKGMVEGAKKVAAVLKTVENNMGPVIIAFQYFTNGISTIFGSLKSILVPVAKAFSEIFPPKTGKDLIMFSMLFERLTKTLAPSPGMIEHVTTAFKGLFSFFSLIGKVVGFVFDAFKMIFDVLFVSTGILTSTGDGFGKISDSVANFFIALNEGKDVQDFFNAALAKLKSGLEKVASPFKTAIDAIKGAAQWFGNFITSFDPVEGKMTGLTKTGQLFADIFNVIRGVIGGVIDLLAPLTQQMIDLVKGMTFDQILKTFMALFSAATLASIAGWVHDFYRLFLGLVPNFKSMFNEVTFILKGMSAQLNASALKSIAVAVLLLAVSMYILSQIPADRLSQVMGVLLGMMGSFVVIIKSFESAGGMKGFWSMAIALQGVAVAILIMAVAMYQLSKLDQRQLETSLLTIALLLTLLVGFTRAVDPKGLATSGTALLGVAVAVLILAKAMQVFGTMDPSQLETSLLTLSLLLLLIVGFSRAIEPGSLAKSGFALLGVAIAIAILAGALKIMAGIGVDQLFVSLTGMAIAIGVIVRALQLVPKDAMKSAAGIIIVAFAVQILAKALLALSSMSWEEVAVSLVALGGALLVLGVFLYFMSNPMILVGAAALLIASASLIMLAKGLAILAELSWAQILSALGGIALTLLLLAVAGLAIVPAIPGLLMLGAALLLLGGAMLLAGAGMFLFASGFALLLGAMALGTAGLTAFVTAMLTLLPKIGLGLAAMLGSFALGLVGQASSISKALIMLFTIVLAGLTKVLPMIFAFIGLLLDGILNLISTYGPKIAITFMTLLLFLLTAIEVFLPIIIEKAGNIVVSFINGMSRYYNKIITAGTNFIINLIRGIAKNILKIVNAAAETILAFINGLTKAVTKYAPRINTAMRGLISAIFRAGMDAIGLYSFADIGGKLIAGIKKGINDAIDGPLKAIKTVINGILAAARAAGLIKSPSRLFAEGVGVPIAQGIALGMTSSGKVVEDAAKTVVAAAYSAIQLAGDLANGVLLDIPDPTITPVINLDNVYKGAKSISSIMADSSSIKVTGDIGSRLATTPVSPAPQATSSTTEIKLEQNNYSPKPLSRLEIYRDTKNLLRTVQSV